MNPTQIQIPKPCHADWNEMTPEQKGRFCHSCQKTVYDFTRSTDRTILEKFQSEANICGRFTPEQLDREMQLPKPRSGIWAAGMSGFLSLFVLGNSQMQAQEKPTSVQTQTQQSEEIIGKMVIANIISGKVIAGVHPVPGALIQIKGKNTETQTDSDGNFKIPANEGDVLIFMFLGMETLEITVGKSDYLTVEMKTDTRTKMGEMVVIQPKKRTFFGRIFQKINRFFTL